MVDVYIKECNWLSLAQQLLNDIRELPKIFGDEEYNKMSKALNAVKDRYFRKTSPLRASDFQNDKRAISDGRPQTKA